MIKSFGKEKQEVDPGDDVIKSQYKADISRAFVDLYGEPLLQSVQGIIMGHVLIYGGYLTATGELGIGVLVAFCLDEAMSILDVQTAEHVQDALNLLMLGRTTVVVAHNLSTVQNAEQIVVIDHGKVNGRGTHKELLEKNVLYRNLVEIQFAKEQ